MGKNLEGIGVPKEGKKVEPGDVFDAVFFLDAGGKLLICNYFLSKGGDSSDDLGMDFHELIPALGGAGIENGPVGEDEAGGRKHPVAVEFDAAAHSGGIIHHNAADHAATDTRRIRSEMASVFSEDAVDFGPDKAGL